MKLPRFVLLLLISRTIAGPVLATLKGHTELSTLNQYIDSSKTLQKLLSTADNFTLLAPSDQAFKSWLGRPGEGNPDLEVVEDTISYHLLHGRFPSVNFMEESQFAHSYLTNGKYTNVTSGQAVELYKKNGQERVRSGNKTVTTIASPPDILCTGGFIQVTNSVLQIPLDLVSSLSQFGLTNFLALLSAGNFVSSSFSPLITKVITAPNMTYFAPDTPSALAAFRNATKGLNDEERAKILKYHLVPGVLPYSPDLKDGMRLKTLLGNEVQITRRGAEIFVNSARIISSDNLVGNGVLHSIDGLLDVNNVLPPPAETRNTSAPSPAPLGTGAKAGIGIGASAGAFILTALIFFLFRYLSTQKKRRELLSAHEPAIKGQFARQVYIGGRKSRMRAQTFELGTEVWKGGPRSELGSNNRMKPETMNRSELGSDLGYSVTPSNMSFASSQKRWEAWPEPLRAVELP